MTNGHDFDRVRSALFALDAGCARDEWVRAGMAFKAAGGDSDTWIEWSSGAGNYGGEHEARSVWRSIKAAGGIGEGTLFKMAKDAGWRDAHTHNAQVVRVPAERPAKAAAARKQRSDVASTFDRCPSASLDHPYVLAKRGTPDGLRMVPADSALTVQGQSVAGWLAVPAQSLDGALRTIQFIPPPGAGKKLNMPGASFGDGLFAVGNLTANGTVYVCEGIGQAWACARADYHASAVVTFGAGRCRNVAQGLRDRYPEARIVIVADRGKESDAEIIAREVQGAWVEMPASSPANYDANDYEAECGSDALAGLLRGARTPPMRYRLQSVDDLLSAPPLKWMVQGVLPASGFAAVYGPSGSGKSFLVLDLCAAVADGLEWFGRRVSAAPVTYVCLEGESGLGKRARAWTQHHDRDLPAQLRFVTQAVDLRSAEDIEDLSAAVINAAGRGGLLVIDTLNRASPGADENSSADMGEIIEACKRLQQRIDGMVLLVHHSGKQAASGLRGHSSLHAALDAAIEVSRTEGQREWAVIKSKDDADGARTSFTLKVVDLGIADDGEPVTSCVVDPADAVAHRAPKQPAGATQQLVFEALKNQLVVSPNFGKGHSPSTRPCVLLDDALQWASEAMICEAKRRKTLGRRALEAMIARGIYQQSDGWLWVA